jgi:hypothetical protein
MTMRLRRGLGGLFEVRWCAFFAQQTMRVETAKNLKCHYKNGNISLNTNNATFI